MKVQGTEFESCKKSLSQSIPNALIISITLLVLAFVILSQPGLHLQIGGLSSPASTAAVSENLSAALISTEVLQKDQPRQEDPGTGIYSTVRHLQPAGLGSYAFVLTGGYRTHSRGFAVVGLASKPFHVFDKPKFSCQWIPSNSSSAPSFGKIRKILPDWGYGRVYTVVVIHCYFSAPVGEDAGGGKLMLHVGSIDRRLPKSEVVAFEEPPGKFDLARFEPPYKYDYLYCGSSLFGNINPDRMREWIAYHVMLFGNKSHFVFHDAGGVNSEAMRRVLEPWVKLGYVTVHDFTEQARFDGYYHNQFLVVNDCLFRYKFDAEWMFFFDVDEYIHVPKGRKLKSVMDGFGRSYSQIMFEQNPMSHNACVAGSDTSRQWGFEKLVFKNVKPSVRLDRKYVLKPAMADSAGVHLSQNVMGKSLYAYGQIVYYHFHNTITESKENCKVFLKAPKDGKTKVWAENTPVVYDTSLSSMAPAVKEFERQQIGPVTV